MDINKEFEGLYEGWKKGKYTIKDKNGKILGTYSSGGKAQKAMDDLMQKGDYDKLEVSIVEEKEWHDGHEPQGIDDQYVEEMEDGEEVEEKIDMSKSGYGGSRHKKIEKDKYNKKRKGQGLEDEVEKEASTYRDKARDDEKKKKRHFAFGGKKDKTRHGAGGYGKGSEEVEVDEAANLKKLKKEYDKNEDQNRHTENYLMLAKAFGSKSEIKKVQDIMKRNEKQGHTSKSDMDWMYKNINPYYDKIRNEETMKLEDTVKQVLTNKPELEEHCGVCDEQGVKEDSDKDEPGTQGDMAVYQKKRKEVAKKFGVKSCSELEGADKKACYAALDKAHVADHEEQVELKKMQKEEKKEQKSFSKMFSHVKSLMQGK